MRDMTPSMTAQSVAANVLSLSYDPVYGKLVPAEAVAPTRWFLQTSADWKGDLSQLLNIPLVRGLAQTVEQYTFPGLSLHNVLRKCWVESATRAGLDAGVSQVIILGAGFDTLAYRLHREYPRVLWLEIDHPATLQVKEKALHAHDPKLGANLRLLANDFSQKSLAELLQADPDFHPLRMSLFVAEGLLMYLQEPEVRELLQAIHHSSAPGSQLLGTILEDNPFNRSSRANLKLKLFGEPYQWRIAPPDLTGFLKKNGFKLEEIHLDKDVFPQFMPAAESVPALPGEEYFFSARRTY